LKGLFSIDCDRSHFHAVIGCLLAFRDFVVLELSSVVGSRTSRQSTDRCWYVDKWQWAFKRVFIDVPHTVMACLHRAVNWLARLVWQNDCRSAKYRLGRLSVAAAGGNFGQSDG